MVRVISKRRWQDGVPQAAEISNGQINAYAAFLTRPPLSVILFPQLTTESPTCLRLYPAPLVPFGPFST